MAPKQNIIKNPSKLPEEDILSLIRNILKEFIDPFSKQDLMNCGAIEGLVLQKGKLSFALKVHPNMAEQYQALAQQIEAKLKKIAGVKDVLIVLTAHRGSPTAATQPSPKKEEKLIFPNIKNIIAVASGKGGVGKSTIAVNLALSLQQSGLQVGLLDGDLYGPSIPRMLGLNDQPKANEHKKLIPLISHHLKFMSMGLLVAEEAPVIWRGPIVQSSFQQLLKGTEWEELDVLVIDLPPGTGDTHLTLVQKVPLTGALIVSTPQDIALLDARRAISMFQKLGTPILGLIENMSIFICPHCQHETPIFHHGGARQESARQQIPFLGEVPLDLDIRHASDTGQPISLQPDHPMAIRFKEIAVKIKQQLFKVNNNE
jgi:ATP-binding protein involved in chromosome partitioning